MEGATSVPSGWSLPALPRPRRRHAAVDDRPRAWAQAADDELLLHIGQRDEPALGALYDRYARLVFSIALRITGEHQDAEEVVQDVFQAVWHAAGGFRAGASVSAWLCGIARHRAIDLTRLRRFRARYREAALDERTLFGEDGLGAEHTALRVSIRAALDALAPAQRRALELAYFGGMSHNEIASHTGEPVGTIKSRIRAGLLRMRARLE
jgi:RNA polymerase sigma-70 factor (ECF subfamily)